MIEREIFGPNGNPRYLEYAGNIHSSGQHLLSLINDVLDLSKLESGKETIHPEPIDLSSVIRDSVTLIEGNAEKAGVSLAVEDALGNTPVTADERAIKQVLLNLLSNAVRYTPAGGRITLSAARVSGAVRIRVTDTGCGISAEEITKVCEPYERAGTAYVRKTEGTGLGLPIVKRLVELHKGRFRIESTLGEGTSVEITLPG